MSLAPLAILFKLELREELDDVESSECRRLEEPLEDVNEIEGTLCSLEFG